MPFFTTKKGLTMLKHLNLTTCLAAITLTAATAIFVLFFTGQRAQAQPQGLMSAPACQCSPATSVAGMSTTLVHCICGGMSCVITEHKEQGKNTNLMQCVK